MACTANTQLFINPTVFFSKSRFTGKKTLRLTGLNLNKRSNFASIDIQNKMNKQNNLIQNTIIYPPFPIKFINNAEKLTNAALCIFDTYLNCSVRNTVQK